MPVLETELEGVSVKKLRERCWWWTCLWGRRRKEGTQVAS